MTDEELAEQYLKEKLEERKDKFVFELPKVYIEDVYQAFLAGLKAGRQWHDLRKDPNDLPEVSPEIERTNGCKVYAIFKDRHYYLVDRAALKNYDDIIAWCELPTFDKE